MKHLHIPNRKPLWMLVSMGLLTGLLLTAFCWLFPDAARQLLASPVWPEVILVSGFLLILTGAKLVEKQGYLDIPKPILLLAVVAGTALIYLFPELFAPGCNGMPKAFAACPASCQITTCSHWIPIGGRLPGGGICDPSNPWDEGCCVSYVTTCDADCDDGGSDGGGDSPPTITGTVACTLDGNGSWCRGGATLNLSASDPQGYATTISGDIDGTPFSCAGPNCTRALPAGDGTIHFKVTAATSGLSSATKSTTFAYDPTPPTASLTLSGTVGAAGWYTSLPHASASGTDSISGISTAQVSVDGGAWQASANLAEGTHTISARSFDNAGNSTTTVAQTVKVDITAPSISSSVTSGTQSGGWYVTAATLTASTSDATSGIALVENRVDGGAWSSGSSATLSVDGIHTVDFRATDRAGLQSTTSTSVKVDRTAPAVTLTPTGTLGSNGWYTSTASITIGALDPLSGVATIEYSLDGGSWTLGGSLALNDGDHIVQARATDRAGNVSPLTTRNVKVDTTVPLLASAISCTSGNNGWYVSDTTVASSASDVTSGIALVETRLDGGTWLPGSSATLSVDGIHTLDFRATDRAGLQSTTSRMVKVDKTGPPVTLSPTGTMGSNDWYTSTVALSISAQDATSGVASIEYNLDGESWTPGSSLTLDDGSHTVEARSTDNAGNQITTSTTIQVDTASPLTALSISATMGHMNWYVSEAVISADSSDATSGVALVEHRLDDGNWQTGDTTLVVNSDGAHTAEFRITDNAGNLTTATKYFWIDATPPSSEFTKPLEGSTNTLYGEVNFSGFSSDATSGMSTVQLSLDNGASWQTLSLAGNRWSYTWDTRQMHDGTYPILARAGDVAGNVEHTARTTVVIANQLPKVKIQDWWWSWDAGQIKVNPALVPIQQTTITISCTPYHKNVVLHFKDGDAVPGELQWDRHCGEGAYAADAGDYPVTVQACDTFGRCTSAVGAIKVPFFAPVLPTWTPTVVPTATITPQKTRPVQKPTSTRVALPPVVVSVNVTPAPVLEPAPAWPWFALALVGFLMALASSSLADKRPPALNRLGQTLGRVLDGQK